LNHGQVTSDETSSFDYNFDTCDIHGQTYDTKESADGIIDSIDNENSPFTLIQKNKVINIIQTTDWGNKSSNILLLMSFMRNTMAYIPLLSMLQNFHMKMH
jgi:hypothetical protein